jgi:hypothetical protein
MEAQRQNEKSCKLHYQQRFGYCIPVAIQASANFFLHTFVLVWVK